MVEDVEPGDLVYLPSDVRLVNAVAEEETLSVTMTMFPSYALVVGGKERSVSSPISYYKISFGGAEWYVREQDIHAVSSPPTGAA